MCRRSKQNAADYSSAFGFPLDVNVPEFQRGQCASGPGTCPSSTSADDVHVCVVNYPLFADIPFVGTLETLTITREAVFRWELAP